MSDGHVISKEEADLRANLFRLGLEEKHLSQVFLINGVSYTLCGFRSKASTKPFLMKAINDEKRYIASDDVVYHALGIAAENRGIFSNPFVHRKL